MTAKLRQFLILGLLLLTIQAYGQHLLRNRNIIGHWTATWATAMQTPVKSFMPYNNEMTDRSVRQVVKVSAGGEIIRLQLSNIFSNEPVEIRSVYIAHALDSFQIDPQSAQYLRFDGHQRVVIAPGKSIFSDAERFTLKPLERLAITINYKKAPKVPTVHMGSRTTSYIIRGYSGPLTDFSRAFRYEKWFNIASLAVYANDIRTFAVLGNSITDGKGATTDHQNRWPDEMSFNLNEVLELRETKEGRLRRQYAVLNLGIGNNRVLSVGFGQPGKERFARDILAQQGVTDAIIFEGINDLGNTRDGLTTARELVEQYKIMIQKCRQAHLRVYIATITPMKGSGYFTANHEAGRRYVNEWIRTQKECDGILDFDKLMQDPTDPLALRPEWRLTDCLHPNALGYKEMGRYAADILFSR
ncbi:MAG: SGNH/GDSL hydrolase family protein [Prevotella sp.]|nr:SGNH/GDSL hydrolase family protein [Prevotella sp.]